MKITVKHTTEEEIELTLPYYFETQYKGNYFGILEDETLLEISKGDTRIQPNGNGALILGLYPNRTTVTKEVFEQAAKEAANRFHSILNKVSEPKLIPAENFSI